MSNRRPRIYCFGCSYTEGINNNNWISYVQYLAELCPEYDIYNYGVGGTSELFHTYLMNTLPEKTPQDISIFQITSMGRLTWWNYDTYHANLDHKTNNIWRLNSTFVRKNIGRITYGTLNDNTDSQYKLAKIYYKQVTQPFENEKFSANIFYASQFFDYAFFHRKATIKNANYDSFKDSITDKQWKRYVMDAGSHFNEVGSKEEAHWVYENLKKNNLLN